MCYNKAERKEEAKKRLVKLLSTEVPDQAHSASGSDGFTGLFANRFMGFEFMFCSFSESCAASVRIFLGRLPKTA